MSEQVAKDEQGNVDPEPARQQSQPALDESSEVRNESISTPTDSDRITISARNAVPEIQQPEAPSFPELPEHARTAAGDILDKQYRLYSWNDAKTQALITTNSIMFAAVGYLYKECMRDSLAMLFLTGAVITLGVSLTVSLLQVIPRVSSGRSGSGPNTRSIRGIALYKTWEDYYNALTQPTAQTLLVDAVRQIYGMAANNLRSTRIIKRGVVLTIASIVMLLGAIFSSAVSARGVHVLGEWQISLPTVTPASPGSKSVGTAPAVTLKQNPQNVRTSKPAASTTSRGPNKKP